MYIFVLDNKEVVNNAKIIENRKLNISHPE